MRGGDGGTRTRDPLNAIEVLSQLSYIPANAISAQKNRITGKAGFTIPNKGD